MPPPNDFRIDAEAFNKNKNMWIYLQLDYEIDKEQALVHKAPVLVIKFKIIKIYVEKKNKNDDFEIYGKNQSQSSTFKRLLKNNKFKYNWETFKLVSPDKKASHLKI